MELYYETSLSAYILIQEVTKDLNIRETLEESKRNGNFKRIIRKCEKIVENRYPLLEEQIRLKTYIENIFTRIE